jgi:deoxyribodipyrimidine photolyase
LVFLVESITELSESYKEKDLLLSVAYGKTESIIEEIITKNNIGIIVASASYVRYFQTILENLGKKLGIPVILIDDASLLPPWIVSDHVEYGAYTLRKKYWNTVTMLSPEKAIKPVKVGCIQTYNDLPKIITAAWYQKYLSEL